MKFKVFKLLGLMVVIFAAVTAYQYFYEDMAVMEDVRATAKMSWIESAHGVTRYQEFGDSNDPTVILIHSFNGFIESWLPNIQALIDAKYHVVAYDLWGRGLSDRPRVKYDLSLFRTQLELVIDAVEAKKIHLVGSSFGAVIAADFTSFYPDKVDGLVLVGPAGWPAEKGRNPLLDVPVLGEVVFHYWGKKILLPKVKDYFVDVEKHAELIEQWQYFAELPGFMRAALSTLRHAPVLDYSGGWKTLGQLNKPLLFIWGKQDISFPFVHTRKIPALMPAAQITGIDDAAHWVNVEQAAATNQAMLSFLASLDKKP